jgi:hypothetical protein
MTFLFYESIPALKEEISTAFYRFLVVYVIAIRLLYENVSDKKDIDVAEKLIKHSFVILEDLFSHHAFTYTFHAHKHLPDQVRQHGPLNSYSMFVFEVKIEKKDFY